MLPPTVAELQDHVPAVQRGTAFRTVDRDLRRQRPIVRRVDRTDQPALETQHAPSAGVAELRPAAIRLPGRIQRARDRLDGPSRQHLDRIDEMRTHVAKTARAPLQGCRRQFSQCAFDHEVAQTPGVGLKTAVVVHDEERSGVIAGAAHPLRVRCAGRDGFFAIDGAHPLPCAGDRDVCMKRRIGRDAYDVE